MNSFSLEEGYSFKIIIRFPTVLDYLWNPHIWGRIFFLFHKLLVDIACCLLNLLICCANSATKSWWSVVASTFVYILALMINNFHCFWIYVVSHKWVCKIPLSVEYLILHMLILWCVHTCTRELTWQGDATYFALFY